jgi:hypothetical protein
VQAAEHDSSGAVTTLISAPISIICTLTTTIGALISIICTLNHAYQCPEHTASRAIIVRGGELGTHVALPAGAGVPGVPFRLGAPLWEPPKPVVRRVARLLSAARGYRV